MLLSRGHLVQPSHSRCWAASAGDKLYPHVDGKVGSWSCACQLEPPIKNAKNDPMIHCSRSVPGHSQQQYFGKTSLLLGNCEEPRHRSFYVLDVQPASPNGDGFHKSVAKGPQSPGSMFVFVKFQRACHPSNVRKGTCKNCL